MFPNSRVSSARVVSIEFNRVFSIPALAMVSIDPDWCDPRRKLVPKPTAKAKCFLHPVDPTYSSTLLSFSCIFKNICASSGSAYDGVTLLSPPGLLILRYQRHSEKTWTLNQTGFKIKQTALKTKIHIPEWIPLQIFIQSSNSKIQIPEQIQFEIRRSKF